MKKTEPDGKNFRLSATMGAELRTLPETLRISHRYDTEGFASPSEVWLIKHTQRKIFPKSNLKSDCIYHFPIDLEHQTVHWNNQLVHGKYNLISI